MVLPCKDTLEQLIYGKRGQSVKDSQSGKGKMGKCANVGFTLLFVTISYGVANTLTSIGDALTIVGSTITPTVGYIIPILYYIKSHKDKPLCSVQKIIPSIVLVVIIIVSGINLYNFFKYKEG